MNKDYPKKLQTVLAKYNIVDRDEFLNDLGELLAYALEDKKPYLAELERSIIKNIDLMGGNGNMHLMLKIYEGRVQQGVFNLVTKVKFE